MSLEVWQRELRRQFGGEQTFHIENVGEHPIFSEFRVTNPQHGSVYRVAIRGAEADRNFCSCADFKTNALGTCKHIELTQLILEGERPFDLFVRWKPLSQQAIGWHTALNDGVRTNIRPFLAMDIPGGKKGAGLLRTKPNIKWDKDRGKEPVRDKKEFPWFWGWDEETIDFKGVGTTSDGNRWNDLHYTNAIKLAARASKQ
jgi:hypothetical protein